MVIFFFREKAELKFDHFYKQNTSSLYVLIDSENWLDKVSDLPVKWTRLNYSRHENYARNECCYSYHEILTMQFNSSCIFVLTFLIDIGCHSVNTKS